MMQIREGMRPLFRLIIPRHPGLNIFTRTASRTTALGPISVATSANKVQGLEVEVVDENNFRGPRDENGLPDHVVMQEDNPATVVGFYCGLSSTMDRVFELAEFYHGKNVFNIAGGWHVHYSPEEALNSHVDIVIHGDGELVIQKLLTAIKEGTDISGIPSISFLDDGKLVTNPLSADEAVDLSELPFPDFGLLRYKNKIKVYPIGRTRGCGMNCEFCSVKGTPRWASAKRLFEIVKWLVDTRGAKKFFIVDDRLEEDFEGTMEFFRLIKEKYGDTLYFMVQIRLEAAKKTDFLIAMKQAGVRIVCVGYESPVDEDLKSMQKGYLSHDMLVWTKALREYFLVHGMFIFGYPDKKHQHSFLSVEGLISRFKLFIREARLNSIQILHPVPIVGSSLRVRLERENRVFPLSVVPWSHYDGNYTCFKPDDMTILEHQRAPTQIMRWFYSPWSFFGVTVRTVTFPIHYLFVGWRAWHNSWQRHTIKFGGHLLFREWQKRRPDRTHVTKLLEYERKTSGSV